MSKEVMKQALEALEKLVRFESDSWESGSCRIAGPATTALREALAEQPAQRKPLTDEEIYKASTQAGMQEHYMGFHSGFVRFARAIEAAHQIGVEK